MLLSLFCGAGGLDLGFEETGFKVGLAFDRNRDSVLSYNENRPGPSAGHVADLSEVTARTLDQTYGEQFNPTGIIGGPPCQSFSQANVRQQDDDPRHLMPLVFARLTQELNERSPVDFFVLENVVGLTLSRHRDTLRKTKEAFDAAGFEVVQTILDAQFYGAPQSRQRLFLVGFNRGRFDGLEWLPPAPLVTPVRTVRDAIGGLPEPMYFQKGADASQFPHHPNHWCMQPRSPKFDRPGALAEGNVKSRSFKTLSWERPSIAVAYGHREVHIHPSGKRRLSVYEAMQLQGMPHNYRLHGTMSSQIRQISEAVPVPLARAVAKSVKDQLVAVEGSSCGVQLHRPDRKFG
ncbi:DNA cytosine methyltransferase [Mesorhizobium sp. ES1-1]|uniref:DNA cytosine methyltransferase n=1 Tax=Mesorhizobium sp. ES1-1 TaxID=2876629 RepID=UPI001CCEF4CA|nr:DNA cytosine methyltransferase [Mesorhizobium sp. ES1-1]MBZ9678697.1 DNA cytosine methyltransferase [Mesorhizobium sp. ES1-1]